jgi:hypothetical protein
VDVTAQGNLSGLVVARRDQDHPQAHPATATGRYWRITPSGSGYTASLTLPHDGLADPYASKYLGPDWDWGREAFTAASVTRSGITAFSDWAVSEGAPALTTPALLSPPDGTITATAGLTLTWQASPYAAGYHLDLGGTLYDVGNTTHHYTGLLVDGIYTWTVAAYDADDNLGPYAAAWSFTVESGYRAYLPVLLKSWP